MSQLELCHNLSFWVLSQFQFFCFCFFCVAIWISEFCHHFSFWVLSQFEFLSFITIWVLNFVTIWGIGLLLSFVISGGFGFCKRCLKCWNLELGTKKSRIRETKHLSTDADSSTDNTVGWTKNTQKPDFFEKRKKLSKTQKLKNV